MKGVTFLVLLLLSFTYSKGQNNVTDGLVAYYPFNGNAHDITGNGHNGQVKNGAKLTRDRFGNAQGAYFFDGIDDYISIQDDGSFSSPHFSLVLWFQTYSDNLQNLVSKRDFRSAEGSAGAQYQFFINYPPYPGIGSNIVGNNSSRTNVTTSSYLSTADRVYKNRWYCVAITFDGTSHKMYIDGILKKSIKTDFNGLLKWPSELRLGNWWNGELLPFKGVIDDFRWYNRALSTQEVGNLYQNFPALTSNCDPNSTNGCFLAPDTVCVNTPVTIVNTLPAASSFYWNFCVANSTTNPSGTNLGNFGFSLPVFMDYAKDGNNYYAFVTNNMPGKLIRLDFGNSLLNTPTYYDFGNLGGVIPDHCEGIQIIKNEGRWYAIIVGGQPVGRIVKVDFGNNLANNTPVATNWGNIGNLAYPTDLHVFQDGSNWYGLTINAASSTITRFNFTNSFNNIPTGINFGNIGGLTYPTGIYAIRKNNFWHAFITNSGSGTSNSSNATLTRLDFGNSLLNTPTGTNLGNPGNTLRSTRDLTIYQACDEIFGFAVNYSSANDVVRLNFNNSLTLTPTALSLGNIGNMSFPHSISKLFRVENILYCFVTNVDNNTITLLRFDGCNNVNIPSSTAQNPPVIVYNTPGTYYINLTVDDGLPTQASYCKRIVVVNKLHNPVQSKSFCSGDSILLTSSSLYGNQWSTGDTAQSIYVKTPGLYWTRTSNGSCASIDSFVVTMNSKPMVDLGIDTTICSLDSLVLNAGNQGSSYVWQNGQTTQTLVVKQSGLYHVSVDNNGCSSKDTILVSIVPSPVVSLSEDTSICKSGTATLMASGGTQYIWRPSYGLSDTTSATITAFPDTTTTYSVIVTNHYNCSAKDSVIVTVNPKPEFSVESTNPFLCNTDSTMLIAYGGDKYVWSPSFSLSHPNHYSTKAFPSASTTYKVIIEDFECQVIDSLTIDLPVYEKPNVTVSKSNDISCNQNQAILSADGGVGYLWSPSTGLSNATIKNPVVSIAIPTTYYVMVKSQEGCESIDSITVDVIGGDKSNSFLVPNAFTPNGDGKNDCFGVKWGAVSDFSLKLFNRWGEIVYQTTDPNQCWNGIYKGILQPTDVFVYLITAKTICGDIFRKGTFTLIK